MTLARLVTVLRRAGWRVERDGATALDLVVADVISVRSVAPTWPRRDITERIPGNRVLATARIPRQDRAEGH